MKHLTFFFGFLCAVSLSAQVPPDLCNSVVILGQNQTFFGAKTSVVADAANKLILRGAEPRIVVDDATLLTPEQYVASVQKQCSSWQSANGGVKNNLIVFLVFPKRHKVGLFVGDEFGKALNTSVIRSQFMAPAFKDGDWARGMIAGMNEASVQIEAFQTAALHPSETVVHQDATDFSGLWKWLDALLVLGGLVGVWGFIVYYRDRRQKGRDAQQRAVQARNSAAEYVNAHPTSYVTEQFTRLSNSETFNPDTNGLSVDQYNTIASRYNLLIKNLTDEVVSPRASVRTKSNHHAPRTDIPAAPSPSVSSVGPSRVVEHHNTMVINQSYQSPAYVPIPVIVEEPIYREPYRAPDPAPVYSSPSSGWGSSSSSSDFGSSSSWSDSSSSSSFDSGSSGGSDFGGGSSDF